MDQTYYDAVKKMQEAGVNKDYLLGWMGGYLQNPEREEQRVNEAYEAGYEDGGNKATDNFSDWINK